MKKIRTLRADEIEVRVQSVNNDVANMLLYIDSRAVTDLLDETYGMENWSFEFKEVAGKIYGRLSIYDADTNRWVYREDCGSESHIEADKGLASDTYKRCIVRFGVTELYSSPKITWKDDGYKNTGYKVSEIAYDDKRNITHLVIVNRFGNEAYRWDKGQKEGNTAKFNNKTKPSATKPKEGVITPEKDLMYGEKTNTEILKEFCGKQKTIEGTNLTVLRKFYDHYINMVENWKGDFKVNALYNNWVARERN